MSINWVQLVAKGRAKDMGIAWNEEELKARYEYRIPAEYVRDGILTPEAYAVALDADREEKPLSRQTRPELEQAAKQAGVEFASEAPDTVLVSAVKKAKKKV